MSTSSTHSAVARRRHQFLESLEQLHGEQSVMPPMLLSLIAWLKLQEGNREEARRWAESFTIPVAGQSIIWLSHPSHLQGQDPDEPG